MSSTSRSIAQVVTTNASSIRRRHSCRDLLVAVLLSTSVAPAFSTLSHADELPAESVARARKLFQEGLILEEKNDWRAALDRFQAAVAIKRTAQMQFHLGLCFEHLGRLVEARMEFEKAKTDATDDEKAQIVVTRSIEHLKSLDQRIPTIVVRLATKPPGTRVELDGKTLADEELGLATRVDPGIHRLRVTAPGHDESTREIELHEGSKPTELSITLKPTTSPVNSAPRPITPKSSNAAPWVFGIAGATALGTAGLLFGLRASALSELDASCDADRRHCDPSKRPLEDRARRYATVGTVLLGVGVTAIGGAFVLYFADRPTTSTSTSTGASMQSLSIRASSQGMQLTGTWRF